MVNGKENKRRASQANRIVEYYADAYGELGPGKDLQEQNISDLLSDMMHLCRSKGMDFDGLTARALMHFNAERNGIDDLPDDGPQPLQGQCVTAEEIADERSILTTAEAETLANLPQGPTD